MKKIKLSKATKDSLKKIGFNNYIDFYLNEETYIYLYNYFLDKYNYYKPPAYHNLKNEAYLAGDKIASIYANLNNQSRRYIKIAKTITFSNDDILKTKRKEMKKIKIKKISMYNHYLLKDYSQSPQLYLLNLNKTYQIIRFINNSINKYIPFFLSKSVAQENITKTKKIEAENLKKNNQISKKYAILSAIKQNIKDF